MATTRSPIDQHDLLAAARGGDEQAFRRLVEPHRSRLLAHCYRMLGSLHDAEDVLQEALLRCWRWLGSFDGRSAFGTWLYRITTNACLDAISRRPRRVLPVDYGPPGEGGDDEDDRPAGVAWLEPYPDEVLGMEEGYASPEARYEEREAIELAFVAALQYLPPRQRAVLILREVLGFSASEVAETLGSTATSVNSALQRARSTVERRIPDRSQQVTVRALGDAQVRAIVERFGEAFERGDTNEILALLTEDATFSMPPSPSWCRGREAIAGSWLMPGLPDRLKCVLTRANGQPAAAVYLRGAEEDEYLPLVLDVLTLRGELIGDVTSFRTPEIFPKFGLPQSLQRQARPRPRVAGFTEIGSQSDEPSDALGGGPLPG
jgi:RNA polymerase sigma-70 factor (ECF subfamily)